MSSEQNKLVVTAPATGEVLAEIEETLLNEVPHFYEKGKAAFEAWRSLTISERIGYIKKLKYYMVNHMEEIAEVISKDTGKVLTEAVVADIMPTMDAIDHICKHAEEILKTRKVKTPFLLIGKKSFVQFMPRGVVLVISPWNYPFQLSMVPIISALAGGNSVILKPSEVTPLVGKYIEKIFNEVGFPQSVFQVAHGGKEVGAAFTNGAPDYIFFTGSVRTGRIIQEVAAKKLIPTTLELGGKDPMIVFKDANLKRAVKGAAWAAFTNSGQVCMSAERLYVERPIYNQFVELLKHEIETLSMGIHVDDDVGSMTFPAQKDIVKEQLEEALNQGGKLETGVHPSQWKEGMFIPLTLVTNVHQDMKIIQEETFGPLLPVIPFDREDEAIKLANGTVFGLNASVWSQDLDKARRVASKLISGAVVINDAVVTVANHGLPFGGTKHSGIGRYHGEVGLTSFCHEKAIIEDRGTKDTEIQWYPYKGKYPLFIKLFKSYFKEKRDWGGFIKYYNALLKKK